jgi:hypothetical protein
MVYWPQISSMDGHARGYVTPKSLEPRSCPNERMEAVKAAALAISAETFRRGAGEDDAFRRGPW